LGLVGMKATVQLISIASCWKFENDREVSKFDSSNIDFLSHLGNSKPLFFQTLLVDCYNL